jgi:uncharacterized protein
VGKTVIRRGGLVAACAFACATAAVAASDPDLRLIDAIRSQNRDLARALLQQKVDVNARQADGATALHWAAQWDDLDAAGLLVRAGAKVNAVNDYGVSPLSVAALNGSGPMVQLLLKAGGDVRTVLPSGETLLMTAARSGSVAAVRALLAAGADVNAKEQTKGQTALMWAVAERHADVARTLVESGADWKLRSASGFSAFLFATRMGDRELVKFFLDTGADINEAADDGATPLVIATVRGHVALAEWLLEQGADPDKDTVGYTALHWAVGTFDTMSTKEYTPETGEWSALAGIPNRQAKFHLIKALLSRGANVNQRVKGRMPRFGYSLGGGSIVGGGSYSGATPFFLASTVGDIEVMRFLVAQGADPNIPTEDGTTPLMATAGISIVEAETSTTEEKLLEALKYTMTLGNDLKAANAAGTTALHATAYVGYNVIAQFLVDQGAELNARDRKGQTPYKIASGIPMSGMFYAQPKTAALLKKLGGTE